MPKTAVGIGTNRLVSSTLVEKELFEINTLQLNIGNLFFVEHSSFENRYSDGCGIAGDAYTGYSHQLSDLEQASFLRPAEYFMCFICTFCLFLLLDNDVLVPCLPGFQSNTTQFFFKSPDRRFYDRWVVLT